MLKILAFAALSVSTAHAEDYILQTKPLPLKTYEISADYSYLQWRWGHQGDNIIARDRDRVDRKSELTVKTRTGLGNDFTLALAASYVPGAEYRSHYDHSGKDSGLYNPTAIVSKSFGDPAKRVGYLAGIGVQGASSQDCFYKDTALLLDLGFSSTDAVHATLYSNYRLTATTADFGKFAHAIEVGIKEDLESGRFEVFLLGQIVPERTTTITYTNLSNATISAPGTFKTEFDAGIGLRGHIKVADGWFLSPRLKMFFPIERDVKVPTDVSFSQEPYLSYEAGAALTYTFSR
jgi:hypothetical protein